MAMKEGTRQIWDYIVAHDGEDFTAQNIADALGVEAYTLFIEGEK